MLAVTCCYVTLRYVTLRYVTLQVRYGGTAKNYAPKSVTHAKIMGRLVRHKRAKCQKDLWDRAPKA